MTCPRQEVYSNSLNKIFFDQLRTSAFFPGIPQLSYKINYPISRIISLSSIQRTLSLTH
jgi:hypothetical protein